MPNITVREALQRVANYPKLMTDDIIDLPAHELICRELFTIANNPDVKVRGASTRANRARKMIMDRLVGTRRAGTHPATTSEVELEFMDLGMPADPPKEIEQ